MIYLSGHVHPALRGRPEFGYMLTPRMGNRPDLSATTWAADTGCFKNPDSFVLGDYFRWLSIYEPKTLLFATAPDRLADWRATVDASLPVLGALNALGIMSAFVAQDGLTVANTPWEAFGCLFIGGKDPWKESPESRALAKEAKRRGKWLHMGRVNTKRRLRLARSWNCDSVDGTYLAFGPDVNLPILEERVKWINDQGQFCY